MREVFADTGYWIALWDPRDGLHRKARDIVELLEPVAIITTQLVLVEALNHVAGMGKSRREVAVRMVRELQDDLNVEIVPQTSEQFRAALERYAARADQSWSLTDCASFVLMEQRGLTGALAYDRDFEQAGFAPLLRDGEA